MSHHPRATDAELAILKSLWSDGVSTIRQLTDRLYPGGGVSHYATIQKLLERLEGKAFVRREKSGRTHRFEAIVDRRALIGQRLRETAEQLCDGSISPLLTQLVTDRRLSSDELASLQQLVEELSRAEEEVP
ncbi:MAG: BlaI/MecI/CopY family transcriptional regulator [Acidobacteriota bacterium]|nr:BlaI/MecI/CopY family transcriptional regulator [Acidobacteriota bacterium]MDH3784860.1 BlaI/MecI/CopY family transcriptional regulator [Acidobacteriota bacterium]